MVLEWRWEQIIRACLNHHPRSVSQLSATYPTCFAPTTVPQNTVTTTTITQSLFPLWKASTLSATSFSKHKGPTKWVLDPSRGTPLLATTATKKTTQMPQKYHPNLKGKGWVRVVDTEGDKKEVDKVWEMQKRILLDSTTLGKRTQSGYRQAAVRHPSLISLSSIKALRTSPSPSPTTRDKSPCQVHFGPHDHQPLPTWKTHVGRTNEVGRSSRGSQV